MACWHKSKARNFPWHHWRENGRGESHSLPSPSPLSPSLSLGGGKGDPITLPPPPLFLLKREKKRGREKKRLKSTKHQSYSLCKFGNSSPGFFSLFLPSLPSFLFTMKTKNYRMAFELFKTLHGFLGGSYPNT